MTTNSMLYDSLKLFHIFSAALFFTGILYSFRLWQGTQNHFASTKMISRIQTLTGFIIIPLAILQLATGFSMISLKHYDFSETWIAGSVIGFIIVIGSWFSFVYFLLLSQSLISQHHSSQIPDGKFKFFRRCQSIMLVLCFAALLSMVFFMANKI